MTKLKSQGLQIFLSAAIVALGAFWTLSDVQARDKITSQNELLDAIEEADAGWDWIPNCGDNAIWSKGSERCKGGNGNDRDEKKREQSSYGIDNKEELLRKVKDLDVGWDWIPRCGDRARWSWSEKACIGGTGNDHDDDDDDDDDKDKKRDDKDKKHDGKKNDDKDKKGDHKKGRHEHDSKDGGDEHKKRHDSKDEQDGCGKSSDKCDK